MLLLITLSCSRQVTQINSGDNLVIYPPPPDTTRIQYLRSISSSSDITGKRSGFAKFIFGEPLTKVINKPYGVSVHKGKIFVCDSGLKGLEIIDLEKDNFDYFIPSGFGELRLPLNCSVDDNGYLYVADGERMQIVIFDNNLQYVNCFGNADTFKPTDVVVQDYKIFVVNLKAQKIDVYSKDSYELLYSFPESETGNDDYLYSPTNISVTDDRVFVSDMGDAKIKIYTHDGLFIRSFGSYGSGAGQFVRPKGVAVDKKSNVYVVDASFENTQVFNEAGNLLMHFGGPYNGPGDMWLPAKVVIDYDNIDYFKKYVDPRFRLVYLIFVTNQYGPDKLNVYGFVESVP